MTEIAYEDIKVDDEASLTRIIKLRTAASNQRGEPVIDGTAVVKKIGR
ncbi:MAG: hypothetical protein WAL72_40170 [Streptosporangiaceae bacterium]